MTPRTPEERERMYRTAFPQLWDSLPPDPAETARREAEEDGRWVDRMRKRFPPCSKENCDDRLCVSMRLIQRMSARAAAGYPVLIAPKGEK